MLKKSSQPGYCEKLTQAFAEANLRLLKLETELEKLDSNIPQMDIELDEIESFVEPYGKFTKEQKEELIAILKTRFYTHRYRHETSTGIHWVNVSHYLSFSASKEKLWSLYQMEMTGGEPDIVDFNQATGQYKFEDRSTESPSGRRGCVYNREAEEKYNSKYPKSPCKGNAVDMSAAMGVNILNRNEYEAAKRQEIVARLDKKSGNWLKSDTELTGRNRALCGYDIGITEEDSSHTDGNISFRCSLWI